jgi:hypothetical protein
MTTRLVVHLAFWLWFIAALFAGRQLLLQRLAPVALPTLVVGL